MGGNGGGGYGSDRGGGWINIGDNFTKDAVGSKNMGIWSVWCRELVLDRVRKEEEKVPATAPPPPSVDENGGESDGGVEKILAKTAVTKMAIGSEDFLSDSIQKDFCNTTED